MSVSEQAAAKETRHREIVNALFAQALAVQKLKDEKQNSSSVNSIPPVLTHQNSGDEIDADDSGKLVSLGPESVSSQVQNENSSSNTSANEDGAVSPPRQDSNRMIALQQQWYEKFQQLIEYKEKHGDCLVPSRYPENKQLGAWVSTQRRNYKARACGMTDERIHLLEGIGFVWATRRTKAYPTLDDGSGEDHRPPPLDSLRSASSSLSPNNTFVPVWKSMGKKQVTSAVSSEIASDESRHSIHSTHRDECQAKNGLFGTKSKVHHPSIGSGGTESHRHHKNHQTNLASSKNSALMCEDRQCDEESLRREKGIKLSRRTNKRNRTDSCSEPHNFTRNVQLPTESPAMIMHRPTPVSNPNVVGPCFIAMPTNPPECINPTQGIPQSISFVAVPPNESMFTGSCVPQTPVMPSQFYPTFMPQQPFYNQVVQQSQPTFVLYPFQMAGQVTTYNPSGPHQDLTR